MEIERSAHFATNNVKSKGVAIWVRSSGHGESWKDDDATYDDAKREPINDVWLEVKDSEKLRASGRTRQSR